MPFPLEILRSIHLKIFWDFAGRYIWKYKWWYLLGAFFIAGTQAIVVFIIELTKHAIDEVSREGATANTIIPFCSTIVGLAVLLMVVRTTSRLLIFTPGRMVEFAIRNDYFAQLLMLQRNFFSEHESGDLISRCSNDISHIRAAFGFGFLQIVNVSITFAVGLVAMMRMDVWTTVFLALPMICSFFVVQAGIAYMFRHWRQANLQLGNVSSLCLSSYKGVSAIQAYNAEAAVEQKFIALNKQYLHTNRKIISITSLIFPLINLIGNVAVFFVLWSAGAQVIAGKLSMGEIMAFLGYIKMVMPPLMSLGWMLNIFHRAATSIERLNEILHAQPKVPAVTERLATTKNITLKATGLGYCYSQSDVNDFCVRNIDFCLPPGKVMGIVGEIGSGKTTLVETILRLNFLASGQLWINNCDAAHTDLAAYHRHFAFAPQKAFLFSMSLRDNLRIALPVQEWERTDLDELLLEKLQIAGFTLDDKQFPQGLDTVVGEKGILLSGGQRQRVALARALLREAAVYVFDDVLSAVDHETEQLIIANLQRYASGNAFIIVSHRISAIQWADEILVLERGAIVARGSHAQLTRQKGYYQDVFRYQKHG